MSRAASSVSVSSGASRPDDRAQAHHQALAQRVDRGVGDLGEALAQIVADRPPPGARLGSGESSPIEKVGSWPEAAIGRSTMDRSSLVKPFMAWRENEVGRHLGGRQPDVEPVEAVVGPLGVGGGGTRS